MKKFIVSILCVATFFLGLGSLITEVGAKFKSDERALSLIRQARQAIGGDAALQGVRSMSIKGTTTHTLEIEGTQRSEQGEMEINLELPNKFGKMVKIGMDNAAGNAGNGERKEVNVMILRDGANGEKIKPADVPNIEIGELRDKIVTMRKKDGTEGTFTIRKNEDGTTTEGGRKVKVDEDVIIRAAGAGEAHRQNELLRTTLSLLLTAPEGTEVGYTYAGEGSVDGSSCDIINVESAGSVMKLYLDKSSHLPRMISYQGVKPIMMFRVLKDDAKAPNAGDKETKVFTRQLPNPETAEFQIKFSDYRTVGGVQFPHKWTQTINGQVNEVTDVTSFEINPANISEKFKERKVFVRTPKTDIQ